MQHCNALDLPYNCKVAADGLLLGWMDTRLIVIKCLQIISLGYRDLRQFLRRRRRGFSRGRTDKWTIQKTCLIDSRPMVVTVELLL